ncbi:MAG TPA: hypothetical protein VLZ77_08365 [Acidimicrobiales bacterium]|nr:hypothetical protein [Acidimicrobiales bacterium]
MTGRKGPRSEAGMTVIEVMLSSVLLAVVIISVGASITVLQTHQVQVNDRTQALDYLQIAQQAITKDLHAASATGWTTPTIPTSMPSQAVTATSLTFPASLGGGTPTITISLNTSTHYLTVSCSGAGCRPGVSGSTTVTQAQIANVDSSSLFTLTTKEVSTTANSVTTNTFYYTTVNSSLVLDTPKVGAHNAYKTTLADPNIVVNNAEYACQTALDQTGATGSC